MDCPIVAEVRILAGPEAGNLIRLSAEDALWMYGVAAGYTAKQAMGHYEGGQDANRAANDNGWYLTPFCNLANALRRAASYYNLCWRKSTAPRHIDGHEVSYNPDGIKVGCQSLTLAQMKAMVAECEKSA